MDKFEAWLTDHGRHVDDGKMVARMLLFSTCAVVTILALLFTLGFIFTHAPWWVSAPPVVYGVYRALKWTLK